METKLIFKGTYIQQDSVEFYSFATQYKVDKIYAGEIVTPDSPFYFENQWSNTDSTVWVLGGDSATCLRWFSNDQAIFLVDYSADWIDFGYIPNICQNDYFPIDDEILSMPVEELEEAILTNCESLTSISDPADKYASATNIYPQPTSDFIKIELPENFSDWNVQIFDATGQEVFDVKTEMANISALRSGVYFIRFRKNGIAYSKKLVKI